MLDILNGLDEAAWAGLAALGGAVITGIGAAWRGTKKNPVEVGLPLPPTDQTPYVLEEVRNLTHRHDEACKAIVDRLDQMDRVQTQIHIDTQVLRERDRR